MTFPGLRKSELWPASRASSSEALLRIEQFNPWQGLSSTWQWLPAPNRQSCVGSLRDVYAFAIRSINPPLPIALIPIYVCPVCCLEPGSFLIAELQPHLLRIPIHFGAGQAKTQWNYTWIAGLIQLVNR